MPSTPTQLIAYVFPPDAKFEGRLVGALERMESGGALRILEVLFVQRDAASGELTAFEHRGGRGGGFTSPLLSFRLDAAESERATQRALDGVAGPRLRELGEKLKPGEALAAVFVAHAWFDVLAEAAERSGGAMVADVLDTTTLAAELGY